MDRNSEGVSTNDVADRAALERLRVPGAASRTVLVIEDVDEHRYLFAHLLRASGYKVIEAADGVKGLMEYRRTRPDAVLLDIGIPGLDGYQVLELIRNEPSSVSVPIIAVSVHAFPDDVARAIALGCTRHIAKPALPREVVQAVHEELGLVDRPSTT